MIKTQKPTGRHENRFMRLPVIFREMTPWLFRRIKKFGRTVTEAIVLEYGRNEYLRRFIDPYSFQFLDCALGFDWHSFGLTTTACGALKETLGSRISELSFLERKDKLKKTPDWIEHTE